MAKAVKAAGAKKPARELKPKYGDPGNTGFERTYDLPWCDKKVTLFKTLRKMKATSQDTAKGTSQIVEASAGALNNKDVRHYSYHARAAGLIEIADVEGVNGHAFYLTKKGQTVDPVKAFKEQEDAKSK